MATSLMPLKGLEAKHQLFIAIPAFESHIMRGCDAMQLPILGGHPFIRFAGMASSI